MAKLSSWVVTVGADDRPAQATLRKVVTSLTRLDRTKAQPKVSLPEKAAADVKGLQDQLGRLSKQRVNLAVTSTTAKADVDTLARQLAKLQAKRHTVPVDLGEEADREIDALKRELTQATRKQNTIPLKLERVDGRVAAVKDQLKTLTNGVDVPVDLDKRKGLTGKISRIRQTLARGLSGGPDLDRAAKDAGDGYAKAFGGSLKGLKGGIAGIVGGLALGGIVSDFKKTITLAGNFEATMREVGVQTGQTGDQLKGMSDLALQMGKDTSFSAQGASDAMLELAKGGMSAAEMRAGALKDTLTLATAGGLELGAAAGYMVQGLNTFGIEAKDAGRVSAALAGAANASTASVEDLGVALSQVGPGAALAGLSIEDTAASLAALTNNGMKGSDAGTSLKTMLTSLQPTTKKTAEAFAEMGAITEDGTNKFYDANGEIKSMSEIAGVLEEGLEGMSSAQKTATLRAAFGSDAYRAAAIMAKEGAKGVAEYAKETTNLSAAEELAQEKTKGFSGALERFQGAVETARIQLGTKFLPILSDVLDYLGGSGMDTFSAFGEILQDTFTSQIGAATGGIRKFIDYLSTHQADVIKAFRNWGNGVFDFGIAVAKMAAGGLRNFADFTEGATEGLLDFIGAGIRGLVSLVEPFNQILRIAKLFNPAFAAIKPIDLSESVANFEEMERAATTGAKNSSDKLRGLADGIETGVIPSVEDMRDRFNKSANTQIVTAAQRDALNRVTNAIENLGTKTDGTQIQIKKFKDISTLAKDEQIKFRARLADAKDALQDQLKAAGEAGEGQKKLTKTWEEGKRKLYDEFIQMGLSKKEAKKLAEEYAGIKPKVETKVTQPGMAAAKADAKTLGDRIREIPTTKKVTITFSAKTFVGADGVRYRVNTSAPSSVGRSGPAIQFGGTPLALDEHGTPQRTTTKIGTGHGPQEGGPSADPKRSKIIVDTARLPSASRNQPNEIRDMIRGYEQGIGNALGKKLSSYVGAGDGSAGSPGGKVPTRNVGAGWGPVQAAMRRHGARAFNTYPGHHPSMAMARDVYPHNWAAANAARALSSVWYVIYRMKIASKNHGNTWRPYRPTNFRGDWRHEKHIHVARRYDQGGMLPHGGVGVNHSGKPERVLTARQNRGFEALVESQVRNYSRGGGTPEMQRLLALLEQRGAGEVAFNFNTYNPIAEAQSVTTNKALQRVGALGLV